MDERPHLLKAIAEHNRQGRYGASLALLIPALAHSSDDPDLWYAKASTLFDSRRCREAVAACFRAEASGLRSLDLQLLTGWCLFAVGRLDEAEASMRRAVEIASDVPRSHLNLAVVLQAQQRYDEAGHHYQRALALGGDDFDVHVGLGNAKLALKNFPAAEVHFRRALEVDSQRAIGWSLLGAAVGRQCKYPEQLDFLARADAIANGDADDSTDFTNYAIALTESGRNREALALYRRYLPFHPFVDGHYAYSLALLMAGDLLEGWQQYEFRWLRQNTKPMKDASLVGPSWAGQNLAGKVMLLHVEQGFGDVFQFVRYAQYVKALGATVLLRVARSMKRLMRGTPGIDRVLDSDEPIPPYDFYINLLSLPRVFATVVDAIPAPIPYIRADAEHAAVWAGKLLTDGRCRVGMVWAGNAAHGNDRFRSMKLSMLSPLLGVEGVRFVSLQKGAAAEEATGTLVEGVDWVDIGSELADFSDTAAVISQLDLVICVDTAVAHLAGALGKPVWLMLPQPADFRWLEGREDSPWYPTMRLFRQSRRDDWTDVVARVKTALEERVRAGPAAVVVESVPAPVMTPVVLPLATPAGLKLGHRPGMSAVAETVVGILQYLPDEPLVGDAIGWYGEYLQPQLELLARLVRPGATLMEVGAGIGAHAVFLGALLGEAGHLFLYESQPVRQRILRQNLAVNGVRPVTVMRRTLGSRGEADSGTDGTPPTTETLDELQLERLDWLKTGTSVAGLEVLDGASDTLWRLRPMMFLAAADEQALAMLAERAREYSYRCWRMDVPLYSPDNFNRRDKDVFAGRSALALIAIPEEVDVDITFDHCSEI